MPVCINRAAKHTPTATINTLQAYMASRPVVTFADLRANVPPLSALTDAELKQVIQDAGFEHDDS